MYDVMCMYTCMCMHRGHAGDVSTVAISADGKYIVSGSEDKSIKVCELSSEKETQTLEGKPCMYEHKMLLLLNILILIIIIIIIISNIKKFFMSLFS